MKVLIVNPNTSPVVLEVMMAESMVAMGLSHSKVRKFHAPPQPIADYGGDALMQIGDPSR